MVIKHQIILKLDHLKREVFIQYKDCISPRTRMIPLYLLEVFMKEYF